MVFLRDWCGLSATAALFLALAATSLAACKGQTRAGTDGGDPLARADAAPVDHLAPGELVEGKQKAFALVLPRELEIKREFPGTVHATSRTAKPEQVANYIRARVQDGIVAAGAAGTKFLGVHAKGELTRDLSIEVNAGTPGVATCDVLVEDVTRPPVVPGLSDDERRRQVGLTPDGKLLDPKHLE